MFTGIIEGIGTVVDLTTHEDSAVLTIAAGDVVADLPPGGSLAVNGVCLTSVVEPATGSGVASAGGGIGSAGGDNVSGEPPAAEPSASGQGTFVAEVMGETLRLTGLGSLTPGDPVNLERCTPAAGRFDGHIVQGHVDGLGEVIARTDHAEWTTLRIGIPAHLAPLTAVKGSIALNGVSLTLTAVSEAVPPPAAAPEGMVAEGTSLAWVEVGLIPATLSHTTFGGLRVGDPVNVEVDVIAKYTARLLAFAAPAASASSKTIPTPVTTPAPQGADHD
ncbi:riboflavin synthase [Brevibacterium casei]|uniref:Riboflavin synthase n=1 Tax=Brevibacterium casei TaxID=33889 RepID=A0A7T4A270_9MICO|nr:riboflavin synthase [Brevibacterium casei]